MHLYRFFNPLVYGADRCVIIVADNSSEALHAYVDRYHSGCRMVPVPKDLHSDYGIIMEVALKKLNDGVMIFFKIFAFGIK